MEWTKEEEQTFTLYLLEEAQKGRSGGDILGISQETAQETYYEAVRAFEQEDYVVASQKALVVTLTYPGNTRAWMLLGTSLSLRELPNEALHCYQMAAEADPTDPYPHYYAADDYRELSDFDAAAKSLAQALKLARKDHAYRNLEEEINNAST